MSERTSRNETFVVQICTVMFVPQPIVNQSIHLFVHPSITNMQGSIRHKNREHFKGNHFDGYIHLLNPLSCISQKRDSTFVKAKVSSVKFKETPPARVAVRKY